MRNYETQNGIIEAPVEAAKIIKAYTWWSMPLLHGDRDFDVIAKHTKLKIVIP